jgi:hypothetical protein
MGAGDRAGLCGAVRSFKDLSVKWRNSTMRRDFSTNAFDENRLIVSYPLNLL